TYAELDAGSARFANAIVSLGVRTGDRVAVQIDKSPEAILLYLACLRAGAVYLPLNPAYTLAELAYFLGDAEPSLVVCESRAAEGVKAIAGGAAIETLDAEGQGGLYELAQRQSAIFETVMRDGDDLAAILYTSGTTGRSKGAMLTHANL